MKKGCGFFVVIKGCGFLVMKLSLWIPLHEKGHGFLVMKTSLCFPGHGNLFCAFLVMIAMIWLKYC